MSQFAHPDADLRFHQLDRSMPYWGLTLEKMTLKFRNVRTPKP